MSKAVENLHSMPQLLSEGGVDTLAEEGVKHYFDLCIIHPIILV